MAFFRRAKKKKPQYPPPECIDCEYCKLADPALDHDWFCDYHKKEIFNAYREPCEDFALPRLYSLQRRAHYG